MAEQLARARAELAALESREAELRRRAQDLDAEMEASDDVGTRARIAAVRMGVSFELAELSRHVRAVLRALDGWDRDLRRAAA